MFCKNCGKELNDDVAFCNDCGTPVGQVGTNSTPVDNDRKKEDNVVRLEIKPTFVWGYQILKEIGNIILWLFILELCFAEDFNFVLLIMYFPLISIVAILAILVIRLLFEKAQYNKMTYKFLKTKVEYIDGFLNKEEKQLKYEHVREVTMSRNILERIFGIGRIRLYTNANNAYNTRANHKQMGKNGVDIHCVVNIEEQYKAIRALLDEIEE